MSRTPYPTDLTDAQWQLIDPRYSRRDIINAILYQTRNGCVWRALPHDLPPYRLVFHYFRLWHKDGTWDHIHDALRTQVRQAVGQKPKPSVAVLDSQSLKTTAQGGPRGADAAKNNRRPQAFYGG
jgi:transposase